MRSYADFLEQTVVVFEDQEDPNDPRLKNLILPYDSGIFELDIAIVGIPFDLGVKNSNGREGAARAPDAIRRQLRKYGTAYNIVRDADLAALSIADFGNIKAVNDMAEMHLRVTGVLKKLFEIAGAVIVLGGGNDLTFATVRALAQSARERDKQSAVYGINVDAHLDVRMPRYGKINSGMPYRMLIEEGIIKGENLFEIGIQGHVNSKTYYDWAKHRGVKIWPLQQMRNRPWAPLASFRARLDAESEQRGIASFVSIDIDSVAQAFAPGSSAPSPDGLFPHEILEISYLAGSTIPGIRLLEIMEVNPIYDEGDRTSRLASNIILEFLAGRAVKKSSAGNSK